MEQNIRIEWQDLKNSCLAKLKIKVISI